MKNTFFLSLFICLSVLVVSQKAGASCPVDTVYPEASYPELTIQTNLGEVVIELDRGRAPLTVNRFLHHVKTKTYDNNMVHRVVPDYVIQTGAFKTDLTEVTGCGTLFNESGNGLTNDRGTLSMARYDAPHSASTSFFINLKDNPNLNPNSKTWGYTVFGYVVSGMDIVDKMAQVKTEFNLQLNTKDVPAEPINITHVRLNQ
ncbi:MAG: peptidylprolyl isomerase [Marinicella sp.]